MISIRVIWQMICAFWRRDWFYDSYVFLIYYKNVFGCLHVGKTVYSPSK